jgi:hypothetical protein
MKALLALALSAMFVTGCGATKKVEVTTSAGPEVRFGSTMTVAQTAFLPLKTGTVIICKGGRPRATVPSRGAAVSVGSDVVTSTGKAPASSRTLQIRHLASGWVIVSCGRQ